MEFTHQKFDSCQRVVQQSSGNATHSQRGGSLERTWHQQRHNISTVRSSNDLFLQLNSQQPTLQRPNHLRLPPHQQQIQVHQYHQELSPFEQDPDIYEPIYDHRWRLLNEEASLHRDRFSCSKSPTPASSMSSRESSLGPTPAIPSSILTMGKIPKELKLFRSEDFGFTLRHLIVYPPESPDGLYGTNDKNLESIFVRSIRKDGPADLAGLEVGDRILSVNGVPVEKKTYGDVVELVQKSPEVLDLVVIQKQDDIIQKYFSDIAQDPTTNVRIRERRSTSQMSSTQAKDSRSFSQSNSRESSLAPTSYGSGSPKQLPRRAEIERGHSPSPSSAYCSSTSRFSSVTTIDQRASYDHAYAVPAWVRDDQISGGRSSSSVDSQSTLGVEDGSGNNHLRLSKNERSSFNAVSSSNVFECQSSAIENNSSLTLSESSSMIMRPMSKRPLPPLPSKATATTDPDTAQSREVPITFRPNRNQGRSKQQRPTNLYGLPPGYQLPVSETFPHTTKSERLNEATELVYSSVETPVEEDQLDLSVVRRNKSAGFGDRNLRRISYLMATQDAREFSNEETSDESNVDGGRALVKLITALKGSEASPPLSRHVDNYEDTEITGLSGACKEGNLEVSVNVASDKGQDISNRWNSAIITVRKGHIQFFKNKKSAKEDSFPYGQISVDEITIGLWDPENDCNTLVIRTNSGSEILLRSRSTQELEEWLRALEEAVPGPVINESLKAIFQPKMSPTQNKKCLNNDSLNAESRDSKKIWKIKVPNWKKNQASVALNYPVGGSIGVPIEACPSDSGQPNVPLLVKLCCTIIEEIGLETIGIYRIPGNSAGINYLTEQVNKGEGFINLEETRWRDVHIVTSLLKLFFRKLPDPIFTIDNYSLFIDAARIEDSAGRLANLKRLIHNLPERNFETLRFVSAHLNKVSQYSEINKMDIKNLAIVFGPTLVRTSDDNMTAMVTDMGSQCRIIESILSQHDWFFAPDPEDSGNCVHEAIEWRELTPASDIAPAGNQALLLNNLQKLEGSNKIVSPSRETVTAKDIVSGILLAANRKKNRSGGHHVRSATVSELQVKGRSTHSSVILNDSSSQARKSSESILFGGVSMVVAVPKIMGNSYTTGLQSSNEIAATLGKVSLNESGPFKPTLNVDSPDNEEENDILQPELQRQLSTSKLLSARRSSESIIHGAFLLASAVPGLVPNTNDTSKLLAPVDRSKSASLDHILATNADQRFNRGSQDTKESSPFKRSMERFPRRRRNSSDKLSLSNSSSQSLDKISTSNSGNESVIETKHGLMNDFREKRKTSEGLSRLPEESPTIGITCDPYYLYEPLDTSGLTHNRFVDMNYGTERRASWSPGVERIVDKEFADRYATEKHSPDLVANDLNKLEEVNNCEKAVLDEDSKVKEFSVVAARFDEDIRRLLDPGFISKPVTTDPGLPSDRPNKIDGKRRVNRVKRNNSVNKIEKQAINAKTRVLNQNKKTIDGAALKQMKTLENQRRIKRRHTVGGTKDAAKFTSWAQTENSRRPCKVFAADLSSQENVDQNLGRACQQRTDNRRFSLQELWLSQNL